MLKIALSRSLIAVSLLYCLTCSDMARADEKRIEKLTQEIEGLKELQSVMLKKMDDLLADQAKFKAEYESQNIPENLGKLVKMYPYMLVRGTYGPQGEWICPETSSNPVLIVCSLPAGSTTGCTGINVLCLPPP